MSDYQIHDDGTITLGEKCFGVVKFKDGHFEPITSIVVITLHHFHFSTPTCRYAYKRVLRSVPTLYMDDTPFEYLQHDIKFAKQSIKIISWSLLDGPKYIEEWDEIDTIEMIFVNVNLCPKLKGESQ